MILTLTGASGAGKTTIAQRLIKMLPNARFLTSFTTRVARPSDLPGEYAYLSNAEFDRMRDDGEFLWTAQVADTRHGTSKTSLEQALDDEGTISVMILVPEVMTKLYEFAGQQASWPAGQRGRNLLSFLVRTPSEDVLRARMRERGDEEAKIEGRIEATLDYEANARATGVDFIEVGNDGVVEEAVRAIARVVIG